MKVTTLITLVVGKQSEPVSLPPGEYDTKKELVGVDIASLKARGFVVVSPSSEGDA